MTGLSNVRKDLFGMPHLLGDSCRICKRSAQNKHHLVPKGMGGANRIFVLSTHWGQFVLESPLISVCGMGNMSGCHKKFHDHLYEPEWVWDSKEARMSWTSGELLSHGFVPHDPQLFQLGHYVIHTPQGDIEVRS